MIKIGPVGFSKIFLNDGHSTSFEVPAWLSSHGLSAYEYSFDHGFNLKEEGAKRLGEQASLNNVLMSIHAPFYINFANPSQEMIEKSFGYLFRCIEYLRLFGGRDIVFHTASCGKLERSVALELTANRMDMFLEQLYKKGYTDKTLCPETMGKTAQIGTYKEIVDLCMKDKLLIPTFDFGHINCLMGGGLKTEDDFRKIIDYGIEKLGKEKMDRCHIHFSKIEYSESNNEVKHLDFSDTIYGPNVEPLLNVLVDYNMSPTIICESRDMMMEDALKIKDAYDKILLAKK